MLESAEETARCAEELPGRNTEAIASACKRLDLHCVVGLLERDGDLLRNTAVLVGPQGMVGRYRKSHIACVGADCFTTPGREEYQVYETPIGRVGLQICYDWRFPEVTRVLALKGADIVVHPTNSPVPARDLADYIPRTRATENAVYFLMANRVGTEGGSTFFGHSQIVDPFGCDIAGRPDDALEWLQRGVTAHGAGDDALRDTLVAAYLRADRRKDATALLRNELQREPSAQVAAELLGAAGDERDSERAWAHEQLAQAAERDGDAGELVTALLADGATAAALNAADKYPVPVAVRLELARIAAVDDLDAALRHYRLLVAAELETSERESYGNAIRHLRAMRKAADAHGRGAEVIAFAHAAREEHTRRRTLVMMLDKLGWW